MTPSDDTPTTHINPGRPSADDAPLSLTVHSMPGDVELVQRQSRLSARLKLLVLFLVCAAPVVTSYFTYYFVRPDGRRNSGELIDPQLPLPALQATTLQGNSLSLESLRGQWLLIVVAGANCSQSCQDNLYFQRQLREGLGKDSDRMDRVVLLLDDSTLAPNLLPAVADATVLRVPTAALQTWLKPSAANALTEHLYVVDPLGNWMMRFAPNMDIAGATKAKRDLERLMRASSFWDTAGRT